jgi:hypothetical protein
MASIVVTGDTSGSITLSAPAVAGSNTLTLPASTGTILTTTSPKTGNVIQVVQAVETATVSGTNLASSNSWGTALSASITPSSSSSKILVMYSLAASYGATADPPICFRLARGSTAIFIGNAAGSRIQATIGYMSTPDKNGMMCIAGSYLDSPSTTSSTTYNAQLASRGSGASSGPWYLNRGYDDTDVNERQRGASSIILMEIAG